IWIDNISIDLPSTLYRVGSYTATPAWVDITPGTDHEPKYPYALCIDGIDKDNITVAANDPDDNQSVYNSTDNGDDWSTVSGITDDLTGVKTAGLQVLIWGDNALKYSDDGGASYVDKRGDYAAVFG